MADPVSSLSSGGGLNACFIDDGEPIDASTATNIDASASLMCRSADAGNPPNGTSSLVDKFSASNTLSFVQGSASEHTSSHAYPQENNATRTTMRSDDFTPYAASGSTGDGQGVFAGAALLKTHVTSGVFENSELELGTASAQLGKQSELQAGLLRVGTLSPLYVVDGAISAEALTMRANYGILNDDGSIGFNAGAGAEVAGFETTFSRGGWSVTTGLSAQLGGSISAGFRDADADGNTEVCFKVSLPAITIGACADNPF